MDQLGGMFGGDESGIDMKKIMEMLACRSSPAEYARAFTAGLTEDRQKTLKGVQGVQNDIDKVLQAQALAIEEVSRTFLEKLTPLYNRRAGLLTGDAPTDEEVKNAPEDKREDVEGPPESKALRTKIAEEHAKAVPEGAGLPGFWLRALSNHDSLEEMINPNDAAILADLVNVDYVFVKAPRLGYALRFVFRANEAIVKTKIHTNGPKQQPRLAGPCPAADETLAAILKAGAATEDELLAGLTVPEGGFVLVKTYYHEVDPDGDPIALAIDGTDIEFATGKNPTVVEREKKQSRGKGAKKQTRTIKYEEEVPSFFGFFKAQEPTEDEEEGEMSPFDRDFEIGRVIRGSVVPRAVEWYTRRAAAPDEDGPEEEDEDEDGEGGAGFGALGGAPGGEAGADGKQDCKQQ